ncbi:hypothetical protein DB347_23035 [Opitutaceae bacterium EW11]|nr:hypothetical protein DB347_23035 [Opitutaceae bacterium EW11]
MTKTSWTLTVAGLALIGAACAAAAAEKSHKLTTVSTRKMADSLHAVIAADQQAYVEQVVERARKEVAASLPGHAALLRSASQAIQKRGAEFSYTLRSLQPIDSNNGPQSQAEQDGLAFVAGHPGENFYTEEELGGRSYFTAVYANRATSSACVECHNANPQSPRRDYRLGDVMGAMVVRVPLEF